MSARRYDAAIFDVFGTVVDWRGGVARAVAAALGEAAGDPNSFADAWRAQYQPAMEQVRAQGRGFVILDVLHRENLDHVLAARGLKMAEEDRAALAKHAWRALDPWPDAVPGLWRLKRVMPVATCSNGNISLMLDMARRGGLPWDAILGAEPARAYKPQPECYLRTAAALGVAPERCLMVAAHNADLAAARAAGLATAFIPRPDEKGHGLGELAATSDWDVVADHLEGVAAAVGA